MSRKYFTVEQANNAMVLVKPIVRDIMLSRRKMIALKGAIKNAQEQKESGEIKNAIKSLVTPLKECSKKITYHLEELETIGCYLKDFELGVIDFPSILNERVVFLTWQHGENQVTNWHEAVHSFDKKKPIEGSFALI